MRFRNWLISLMFSNLVYVLGMQQLSFHNSYPVSGNSATPEGIMPSFAPITIPDAQSTPVDHTFSPARIETSGGKVIAIWEDRSSGVIVGYWRLRLETNPKNANRMLKTRIVLERATLETLSNNTSSGINPAPTLAYYTTATAEFWSHERSTLAERSDVLKILAYALGSDTFTVGSKIVPNAVLNIEAIY